MKYLDAGRVVRVFVGFLMIPLSTHVLAGSGASSTGNVTVDTTGDDTNRVLKLTVLDAETKSGVGGAAVVAGEKSGTTGSDGCLTLTGVKDGAPLSVTKTNYAAALSVCNVPKPGTHYQTVRLQPTLESKVPVVDTVVILPGKRVLLVPDDTEKLDIELAIDWKLPMGGMAFYRAPACAGKKPQSDGTSSFTFVPYDGFLHETKKQEVSFWAVNASGQSAVVTAKFDCRALPEWLTSLGLSRRPGGADGRKGYWFAWSTSRGLPLLKATADPVALDFGVLAFELGAAAEGTVFLGTDGSVDLDGKATTSLKVLGKAALPGGIKPYGAIDGIGAASLSGTWFPAAVVRQGKVELKIRGRSGVSVPFRAVLLLYPPADQVVTAFLAPMPAVADWIDKHGYVDAWSGPFVSLAVPFVVSNDTVQAGAASVGGGLENEIKGHVGIGAGGFQAYAEALIGGTGGIWIRVAPDEGIAFEKVEEILKGWVEVGLLAFGERKGFEWKFTWPEPTNQHAAGIMSATSAPLTLPSEGASLLPRDYVQAGNYARFRPPKPAGGRASGGGIEPTGIVHAEAFVENVFPNTTAAVAGRGTDDVWVVFSHDNTNLVQIQAMDIRYTRFDGVTWTAPAPVAENTQSEFCPVLSLDASNRPVAAWMRVRDPAYTATNDLLGFLSEMDVVASFWDAGQNRWADPAVVSTREHLNAAPALAPSRNGELALWWQSNPSNQVMGGVLSSNSAPSDWWWARWNAGANAFGPPEIFCSNMTAAAHPAFLLGGTQAWAFWVQDADANPATTNDTRLRFRRWAAGGWSAATNLTGTNAVVGAMQAALLTNDVPLVVWWQDSSLLYDTGPAFTNARLARAGSGSLIMQEFHLAVNPADGRAVLVFPAPTSNGVSLTYRTYDPGADLWGGDLPFDASDALDRSLAPAFIGGCLHAVFTRGVVAHSNDTVEVGGSNVVLRVPYRERTDLMYASFDMDADAAVDAVDVPAGYPPVLRVGLVNAGDLLLTKVVVEVRRDSPAGPVVAAFTNAAPLPSRTRVELAAPWAVTPDTAPVRLFAIADPAGEVAESLEGNNTASTIAFRGALEVTDFRIEARTGSQRVAYVTVRNPVARAIRDVTVTLRNGDTNGLVLAAATITNVDAFCSGEAELAFDGGGVAEGTALTIVATAPAASPDDTAAEAILTGIYERDDGDVPTAPGAFRFLRPGLSNQLNLAWNNPPGDMDGVYVLRALDTNTAAAAGFAPAPASTYRDPVPPGSTGVVYAVRAFNGEGIGPASATISTRLPDANGDGLPDDWQRDQFLSETNAAAGPHEDPDRDGALNWMEYLFGTSGNDSNDFPEVRIRMDGANRAHVLWRGAALQSYQVWTATNLVEGWTLPPQSVVGVEGTNDFAEVGGADTNRGVRVFRVSAP